MIATQTQRPKENRTRSLTVVARILFILILTTASGCSVRRYAINKLADALAGSGTTFASDEDLELVRDAVPFSLKLIESLLAETPRHRGLLQAAASGFTQYAYAFVQQDADQMEGKNLEAARALHGRARRLYLRARQYGLRGLEVSHRGFSSTLRADRARALGATSPSDVPLLYWTAVSWAAAISISKDNPELVADLPLAQALIDRALELDEDFENGAIHSFLITYEMSRQGGAGDPAARARRHFDRAMQLSKGQLASPLVALAEAVSVSQQNRAEFEMLLGRALAIDVDARPEWRLTNLVMQRRARWLLSQVDELFA